MQFGMLSAGWFCHSMCDALHVSDKNDSSLSSTSAVLAVGWKRTHFGLPVLPSKAGLPSRLMSKIMEALLKPCLPSDGHVLEPSAPTRYTSMQSGLTTNMPTSILACDEPPLPFDIPACCNSQCEARSGGTYFSRSLQNLSQWSPPLLQEAAMSLSCLAAHKAHIAKLSSFSCFIPHGQVVSRTRMVGSCEDGFWNLLC